MVFWIRISFLFHEVRIFYILNYDFLLRLHNLISSLKNNLIYICIVYMVFDIGIFFLFFHCTCKRERTECWYKVVFLLRSLLPFFLGACGVGVVFCSLSNERWGIVFFGSISRGVVVEFLISWVFLEFLWSILRRITDVLFL